VPVHFDFDHLRALVLNIAAYGEQLSKSLFAAPALQTAIAQARTSAQVQEVPLRLRLLIGPSAPELHSLRWETLRDPQDGSWLLTNEHLLFSRYLSSWDWRPVRLRPRGDLRALVVIANPANLATYQLTPLDVAGELVRAEAGLSGILVTALASG